MLLFCKKRGQERYSHFSFFSRINTKTPKIGVFSAIKKNVSGKAGIHFFFFFFFVRWLFFFAEKRFAGERER